MIITIRVIGTVLVFVIGLGLFTAICLGMQWIVHQRIEWLIYYCANSYIIVTPALLIPGIVACISILFGTIAIINKIALFNNSEW